MFELNLTRQSALFTGYHGKIPIIGGGGVGSVAALCLSKMGCSNIELWDADTVETHNIPNQMLPINYLSGPKVEAVQWTIEQFTGNTISVHRKFFTETDSFSSDVAIVIMCVDKMSARKLIFEKCKESGTVDFLIDSRIGGITGELHTLDLLHNKESVKEYEENYLFSDEEAFQEACSAQSIFFNTLFVGAMIGSQVRNIIQQKPIKAWIPFSTEELSILI